MPWVAATHAAISGSRRRPWAVNALPEKFEPMSLASAALEIAFALVRVATSVAVMPRLRARIQATRSRESATMRASRSALRDATSSGDMDSTLTPLARGAHASPGASASGVLCRK